MNKAFFFGIIVSVVTMGAVAIGCSDAGGGSSASSCQYQGKTYAIGETFAMECNTCTCTANGRECTGAACLDSGSDAGTDAAAIDAADFSSFVYSWYGTGVSESFMLDHDCGVTTTSTTNGTPPKSGSGIVAIDDCEGFEKLVTSAPVVSALSDKSPTCTSGTDDNGSYTLKLSSGATIGRSATGCSSVEPFATLQGEMGRIGGKYATSSADAGADADAHD